MSTGIRYTLAMTVCIVAGAIAFILLVGSQQYKLHLTANIEATQALIEDRPQLQLSLYQKNKPQLQAFADDLMNAPAVSVAAVYESNGNRLTEGASLPALASVRGSAGIAEQGIVRLGEQGAQQGTGFFPALISGAPLYLSSPISVSMNPGLPGLTAADFVLAAQSSTRGSRNVMGYALIQLDSRALVQAGRSAVLQALALFLIIGLVCGLPVYLRVRTLGKPLAGLDKIAGQIAAGNEISELEVPRNAEFRKMADAVNEVIRKVKRSKQDAEVSSKLLSRKVDESASKLSEQDDKLTQAAEAINDAKYQLHKVTFYDSLTSLPNRALFQEYLQRLLLAEERNEQPLALLLLNLNKFRRINDTLGYSVGDLVLTEVGRRLTDCVGSSGFVSPSVESGQRADVSRLGGDEFAVILNQIDEPESAAKVAQRIIDHIIAPIHVLQQEIVVSPRIGIALAPEDAADADGLARSAGVAMKNASTNPRGAFLYYSEDLVSEGLDHFKLESELRKAIEHDQMQLYYQPQIDTADGSIVCVEALLRWVHPEHGVISPAEFIPTATKIGLLEELGNWTMQEACRQVQELRDAGLELPRVALNIAPDQVGSSLVVSLCRALESTGIGARSVEFGLSEVVFISEDSEEMAALREASDLGVHISLDNFGISATPLSHLSLCPLNEMKIDRHIVNSCDANEGNASLVKAVIAIAESLDLRVVAEGVETDAELDFLINSGARFVQGFLFSEPLPPKELRELLEVPWPFMSQLQKIKLAYSQ